MILGTSNLHESLILILNITKHVSHCFIPKASLKNVSTFDQGLAFCVITTPYSSYKQLCNSKFLFLAGKTITWWLACSARYDLRTFWYFGIINNFSSGRNLGSQTASVAATMVGLIAKKTIVRPAFSQPTHSKNCPAYTAQSSYCLAHILYDRD